MNGRRVSLLRLVAASLLYHGRMNLAVAGGVAIGTAVLTGALLVGDSMRGSLRHLTLDRLGRIDEVMVANRFFRAKLADELAADPAFHRQASAAVPVIMLRASMENADSQSPARANQVNLMAADERFWELGSTRPSKLPGRREIVLNRPLAEQLGVAVGDAVLLRLPKPGAIPAESVLGQKNETVSSQRLTVCAIIPAEGLGHFALRPSQQQPRNAYVSLADLQSRLDLPGRANAILVAGKTEATNSTPEEHRALQAMLRPTLADYGISIQQTPRGYVNITSDRMILPPAVEKALLEQLDNPQPVLVHLANTIAVGRREIPYSTIAAIDFTAAPPLGPFLSVDGKPLPPLAGGEVALNSWAAEQLHAAPGDAVRITYFVPESADGKPRETTATLRLAAIVELSGAADDRALVPALPGVTDQLDMTHWLPPFPFDARRVRREDDAYWKQYGPTPKAFVSLAIGRRLWASRFGQSTSIRIDPPISKVEKMDLSGFASQLHIAAADMGFVFQPVKQQGLAAAAGTTPFSVLFLAFSIFIIIAAVMLVSLLFRLGIERRASQIGILLAIGFTRRKVRRLLAIEGLAVAAAGSLLGVAAGVGYAALMLVGLQTLWLDAIVAPCLRLYVTPESVAIGYGSGLLIAMLTIWWSVRQVGRVDPRQLLAGQVAAPRIAASRRGRRAIDLALLALAVAPVIVLTIAPIGQDVQAGAFFAAGAVALGAVLAAVAIHLRAGATGPAIIAGRGNLLRLAVRNAARNPGRSTLSIGLVASACFLIVAVSALRLDPSQLGPALHSGNGGFALVAQSDQPIYRDLNTPEGRAQLGFSPEDEKLLARCTIISMRVKAGDDASCLNLYRPRQPRLLGVPPALRRRDGFAWADVPKDCKNPWQTLQTPPAAAKGVAIYPVILEQNTANYALDLWKGLGENYNVADNRGRPLRLQVAALLADSIFQGDLLVDESALLAFDPDVSGYRFFLIETPANVTREVQLAMQRTLGDYGFATETTAQRLAGFLAVQNTYLSAFQSLGALGLLLGTIGLAVVQLRNVLERRGELALLRAVGFRRATLVQLVVLENVLLLVTGILGGSLAALVAVLPHLAGRGASIPWGPLALVLLTVLAAGILASLTAVQALVRAPLLESLREER